MLKSTLTGLLLPLVLLFGTSSDNSAARSNQKEAAPQTDTVQKMVVASGTATIEVDLNRFNGTDASTEKPNLATLHFSLAPDSFFTVVIANDLLRGPLPGSIGLIPQNTANLPAPLNASLQQLVLEKMQSGAPYEFVVRDSKTGFVFFNIERQQYDYDAAARSFEINHGALLISDEFASQQYVSPETCVTAGKISLTANLSLIETQTVVNGEVQSTVLPPSRSRSATGSSNAPDAVPLGPDVIVGDLYGLGQFGSSSGTQVGLAVGTVSCNNGTVDLNWFANPSNDHPVIPQNLYRMSGGGSNDERFEQIGQSSVKHAFTALTEDLCATCNNVGGSHLGVGCSDPYGPGLNAGPDLGSRAWINPFTGVFPRNDSATPNNNHSSHSHPSGPMHRVLVEIADLNTSLNPGATYYAEGQYVTPHEYAWCSSHPGECNQYNNVSYRRYNVSGTGSPFSFTTGGFTTQRQLPAIKAWTGATINQFQPAPGVDGHGMLGYKVTNPSAGVWRYEYAVYNENLDRAIQSFSVPLGTGATVSNIGFHAPPQHPGWVGDGTVGNAGYSSTAWTSTQAAGSLTWNSQTFAQNQNANAIRWGTLYNFRFDSNKPPQSTVATLGPFKTGSAFTVAIQGPIDPPPTPTPTATPTPPPTPTPGPTPSSMVISLPTAMIDMSMNNFTQPVTTTAINAAENLIGFQGDFTFNETVVSFQSTPLSAAGLTAGNWNVTGNVIPGTGPMRTLRISAFSNDGNTPLSGSGTLFNLNMTRVSGTPGASTALAWAAAPNNFIFFDTNLIERTPSGAPGGAITIQATATVSISGTAVYCSNPSLNPVPGVVLTLTGSSSGSATSDGSGNYSFAALASGGSYTITPSKTALTPGSAGITTVDVLAAQRHFLGIAIIPAGCRVTAADVNGDTSVTTVDVVAIQRFFLGLTTGIANAGKYNFTPASRSYPGLASNQTGQNYDTLVFGDIASGFVHRPGSQLPDAAEDNSGADSIPVAVSLPNVSADQSKTNFTAPVTTTGIDAKNRLVGFQGDFTFDERAVTFQANPVEKSGLTRGNWNVAANVLPGAGPIRTVRVSAYSTDLLPLSGVGTLFQLKMIRIGQGTGGTQLIWAASPNQFIFIDAELNVLRPSNAAAGRIAVGTGS